MKLLLRHQALLVLATGLVFFAFLGGSGLFNDKEAKSAACSAEMFRTGVWIVPTFNGELQTDEPILINWLMLISYRWFGVSEFSSRLPSALMAVGTVLLTYHLGRKMYSSDIGFLAAMILCTCLQFAMTGRAATSDATFVFLVTCSLSGYVWNVTRQRGANFCRGNPLAVAVRASKADEAIASESVAEESKPKTSRLMRVLSNSIHVVVPIFIPLGFAVMAYGPLGVILPCVVLLLFLLISKRFDDLESQVLQTPLGPRWRTGVITLTQVFRPRPLFAACFEINLLTGLLIVAAIACPWYLAIGNATRGAWWRGFMFDHHFGPAFQVKEGQNGFPFYQFYPIVLLHLGCFPWSVFLPVAGFRLWERLVDGAPWRESDRLLSCWIGVWIVVFSLFSTKSPNSLLPIFPAIALILARYFNDWKRAKVDFGVYSFNLCCRAMWISGGLMALGLYVASYLYFPSEQWIGLIGLVPIITAFVAMKLLEKEMRLHVLRTLVAAALILTVLSVVVMPVTIRPYQDSPMFIAEARQMAKSSDIVIGTYDYFEPSLVFYAGKNVRRLESSRKVADFIASHPHAFVITREKNFNDLRADLSSGIGQLSRHRNFMSGRELVLVGRY